MNHKEEKPLLNSRYIIISIFIILFGIFIIGRLVNLQIVNGQEYYEMSVTRTFTDEINYATRGSIFDRNGIPIADSRLGIFLKYVGPDIEEDEKNKMFLELVKILDKNGDT